MTKAGTYCYMAPEILNHETYSTNVDIWSLGILLYELRTKKRPFNDNNVELLIRKIMYDPPQNIEIDLDKDLQCLLEQMLSKDPS